MKKVILILRNINLRIITLSIIILCFQLMFAPFSLLNTQKNKTLSTNKNRTQILMKHKKNTKEKDIGNQGMIFSEDKKIKNVINLYFQGARDGNIKYLKQAFHENCKIYFIDENHSLKFYDQEEFHNVVLENYKMATRNNKLIFIDYFDNVATAKVRADYPEFYFVDY